MRILTGGVVAAVIAGLVVVAVFTRGGGDSRGGSDGTASLNAVIVDQLSLTQPNPQFGESATNLLRAAGYAVDYYSGRAVTVDLFRKLPESDYDLVILRAHSAVATVGEERTDWVAVFTGELYDGTKHPEEQATNRVGKARAEGDDEEVFAITPDFIRGSMSGRFADTIVVLMGCDGLVSPVTGQAFLEAGASAFVSWTKPVSASHTDGATERLLEKLVTDGLGIEDAVAETAAEVGADPYYGGELRLLAD